MFFIKLLKLIFDEIESAYLRPLRSIIFSESKGSHCQWLNESTDCLSVTLSRVSDNDSVVLFIHKTRYLTIYKYLGYT